MLSLFYAYDEGERTFWQDPDYVIGIFTPAGTALQTKATPEEFESFYPETSLAIGFEASVGIPRDKHQVTDWPFGDDWFIHSDWQNNAWDMHPSGAHMLGYPRNNTFSHDPVTKGKDVLTLITLPSLQELGWCWHDGDTLVVFQEREKLMKGDFSGLTSDAG